MVCIVYDEGHFRCFIFIYIISFENMYSNFEKLKSITKAYFIFVFFFISIKINNWNILYITLTENRSLTFTKLITHNRYNIIIYIFI